MTICEKVRVYLDENKLTRKEIAERANISYPAFNAMMVGKRKMYPEELRAICFALKVKPEVFMNIKLS